MTEVKKYFVYKISGHYYTIDVKPVYEKVLFEGTEKECYEFVKKELEMFEKEAKHYANKWLDEVHKLELEQKTDPKPKYIRIQQAFEDGAEFGYNKANEWHFVKDGINPTHSYRVLVFTDEGVGFGIYGLDDKKWHTYDTGFDVIAWKEIVLPNEEISEVEK